MVFPPEQLVAFLIAVCFAAGLNVSGTVAVLGLMARSNLIALPGDLGLLANGWVIGIACALFVVEVIADKVPLLDLVWNVLQTFFRVPAGAVLAYAATPSLNPGWQLAATALGGGLALVAHTGKSALRTAVTPSPEPASNIVLSLAEDGFALFIVWVATQYPLVAAAIVLVTIVVVALVIRWLLRGLKALVSSPGPRPRRSP